jgi:hypothetical protein
MTTVAKTSYTFSFSLSRSTVSILQTDSLLCSLIYAKMTANNLSNSKTRAETLTLQSVKVFGLRGRFGRLGWFGR